MLATEMERHAWYRLAFVSDPSQDDMRKRNSKHSHNHNHFRTAIKATDAKIRTFGFFRTLEDGTRVKRETIWIKRL